MLKPESRVEFYPLHIGEPENGQQVVGRADSGEFIALPPEGVFLIRQLQAGLTVSEASARFTEVYGAAPELDEFVEGLVACGFVSRIDDAVFGAPTPVAPGWRLLGGLAPARLAWLYSAPMRALYWALWVAVPLVLLWRPDLLPTASFAVVHPRVVVNALAVLGATWLTMFLHEVAHLLAVRAHGLSGYLSVSHRLHFLVAHVDMSAVRTLLRAKRYGPYLAGMTWDMAVLLCCLLLRANGIGSVLPGLVAYVVMLSLIFQFGFFMRTDIYYVVANWLDLGNLLQDTQRWLVNVVSGRPRYDLSAVPARELRIVKWYALFYVAGVAVVVGQFLLLGLPLLIRFAGQASASLLLGPSSGGFWDGLLFWVLTLGNFGVLGFLSWRERRRARA